MNFKHWKKTLALAGLGLMLPLSNASAEAGYDKGFYIADDEGNFKLKTNLQVQSQYQFLSLDEAGGSETVHTFQIRRGRIAFSGFAFSENLTFKFQIEALGGKASATNKGADMSGPSLKDGYINYKFADYFQLRTGQHKLSFNREELTSSSKQQFVDRSMLNDVFTLGRDLGLTAHGKFAEDRFHYAVYAAHNGKGDRKFNDNFSVIVGARVSYNLLGDHGYTMADVKDSEDHHLVISAGGAYDSGDVKVFGLTGDIAYRYNGFSALGEFNYGNDSDSDVTVYGFLGQAGYFILPERFEVAGRGVAVMVKDQTNGYEFGGALNYYFKGHNLKLQLDYAMLLNSSLALDGATGPGNFLTADGAYVNLFTEDKTDHRVRLQLQLKI